MEYDRTKEDKLMRDDFTLHQYTLAVHLGYDLGFTPYQLGKWFTFFKKLDEHILEHLVSASGMNWSDLVYQHLKRENISSLFTTHQTEKMIEFIISGYGQHARLISQAFKHPQDIVSHYVNTSLLFPNLVLQPLGVAIPSEKWDDYCKAEEEKLAHEKQLLMEQKAAIEWKAQIDLKLQAAHEVAAQLLAKQGWSFNLVEAEHELQKPLPGFPEKFELPPYAAIFRKLELPPPSVHIKSSHGSIPHLQKNGVGSSMNLNKSLPNKAPVDQYGKRLSVMGKPSLPTLGVSESINESDDVRKKKSNGRLPPPPNYKNTPNLESWLKESKGKPTTPLPHKAEPPKPIEKPKKEYEPLPEEQSLNRAELVQLVGNHMEFCMQDWLQHIQSILDWDMAHWQEKIDAIQSIKVQRELEAQRLKLEQEQWAAKVVEKKPEPVVVEVKVEKDKKKEKLGKK